jgi:DNA processing protein
MNNVITIKDKNYPKLLKEIGKEAPKQLYYKGQWDESIFENCLAVVGSRQMTSYGKRAVEQIVTEVAAAGITIVSGFMYGVDAAAHKAVLSVANGRTIAVMPCGINLIHPEYQQDLYSEILNNNGLVISEYEGDFAPAFWTYPQRNRIVAGISKAVLIIEAGEKSGSLITANWAKKFKRKIFAVPGPITSEVSKGTLQLLKEGAGMATSAKDILEYYGFNSVLSSRGSDASQKVRSFSPLERQIIEQLQREPLEIDILARTFGLPVSKLGVTLSMMQLQGLIKQEGNKFYVS